MDSFSSHRLGPVLWHQVMLQNCCSNYYLLLLADFKNEKSVRLERSFSHKISYLTKPLFLIMRLSAAEFNYTKNISISLQETPSIQACQRQRQNGYFYGRGELQLWRFFHFDAIGQTPTPRNLPRIYHWFAPRIDFEKSAILAYRSRRQQILNHLNLLMLKKMKILYKNLFHNFFFLLLNNEEDGISVCKQFFSIFATFCE